MAGARYVLVAAVLLAASCGGGKEQATPPASSSKPTLGARLAACESADTDAMRACYARKLTALAWKDPTGFLLPNCHVLMHAVGRSYVARHHVTLERVMSFLPLSNDPSCPAGFSHGLIIGVAPQIDLTNPRSSARRCERAATRYERYS